MHRYWASYGRSGFLGGFTSNEPLRRGASVVVMSARGIEVATILNEADPRFAIPESGTIERSASADDLARHDANRERATSLLVELGEAPALVADAEMLLDGAAVILHVMPLSDADLSPWVEELSRRIGLAVQVLNLAELPREKVDPTNCGKPNCGSGGGCTSCGSGCSTGSCSKGSVKSAEELTAYFSQLRQQMEKRTSLA